MISLLRPLTVPMVLVAVALAAMLVSPAGAEAASSFLRFPWASGKSAEIINGYNTSPTHVNGNKWALDFKIDGGSTSAAVTAVHSGTVVGRDNADYSCTPASGLGKYVDVQSNTPDGTRYARYAHLSSVSVSLGQTVARGAQLGTQGNTGWVDPCSAVHLHFRLASTQNCNASSTDGCEVQPEPTCGQTGFAVGQTWEAENPWGAHTAEAWRARTWYLSYCNSDGNADTSFEYGLATDTPLKGDWDGDGDDTVGVWRARTWLLRNSNSGGGAEIPDSNGFEYGLATDTPLTGDWIGQGYDTPGVWRSNTVWYLKNRHSGGFADIIFAYGLSTDIPLMGDWDGDGDDTSGVWRNGSWRLRNCNTTGCAETVFTYGWSTDVPIVGDWNGDGVDTVGIRRGTTWHLRNSNSGGSADLVFDYGITTDTPLTGNWSGH